jgi:ABC-type antimicrobial peptide transport system permease subunit
MVLFSLRYAGAELRRRWSRALITALGLAAGVSLIVAISGISAGFNKAGEAVLSPLGHVGTDILVTQTASANTTGSAADTAKVQNSLLQANRSVVTNLASLGKPGASFTKDFFLLADMLPVQQSAADKIAGLPHVSSVSGALTVLASHQTGIVPKIVASLTTGGQTVTQTAKPAPLTDSEAATVRSCILTNSGLKNISGSYGGSSSGLSAQIEKCLPERFKQYVASINVPLQTVKQVMNPPQTNIKATSYTAAGIDPNNANDGVVTAAQVVAGSYLSKNTTDQLLADSAYAASARLHVGSILPINGTKFHVVGIVNASVGGQSANLYFPLSTLQKLTGQSGHVNLVLVRADNASSVAAVTKEIHNVLPDATLLTASQLADSVKGSLATARHLTSRFGGALAIIVLAGALLITVLLTLGSVAKRIREIGTLRAVGWSRRRMVGQLMLETTGIGVAGALIGITLGILGGWGLSKLAPTIAIHSPLASASAALAKLTGGDSSAGAASVHVHINSVISGESILIGAALALLGSMIAGSVAGWRASSLTPAVALRNLG